MTLPTSSSYKLIREHIAQGWAIAFHGCAKPLLELTEDKVGKGADCNSPLGFFMAHSALSAFEYAEIATVLGEGQEPQVYAVLFKASHSYTFPNWDSFYGVPGESTHVDFACLRAKLLREGYDSAEYDDGETSMVVSLDPATARVMCALTLADCEIIDEHFLDSEGIAKSLQTLGKLEHDDSPKESPSRRTKHQNSFETTPFNN